MGRRHGQPRQPAPALLDQAPPHPPQAAPGCGRSAAATLQRHRSRSGTSALHAALRALSRACCCKHTTSGWIWCSTRKALSCGHHSAVIIRRVSMCPCCPKSKIYGTAKTWTSINCSIRSSMTMSTAVHHQLLSMMPGCSYTCCGARAHCPTQRRQGAPAHLPMPACSQRSVRECAARKPSYRPSSTLSCTCSAGLHAHVIPVRRLSLSASPGKRHHGMDRARALA